MAERRQTLLSGRARGHAARGLPAGRGRALELFRSQVGTSLVGNGMSSPPAGTGRGTGVDAARWVIAAIAIPAWLLLCWLIFQPTVSQIRPSSWQASIPPQ